VAGLGAGLERRGALAVEVHHNVDPRSPVFREAVEVSKLSWRTGRAALTTSLQGTPRLFRELLQRAGSRLRLPLWILRLDGRAIAAEYQVGTNGHLYTLGVDDDAELADLRPGAYLNASIVRALFDSGGTREYSMGPLSAARRLAWANGVHESLGLQLYAASLYGRLLHWMAPRRCA
jgi:hypothetical protein